MYFRLELGQRPDKKTGFEKEHLPFLLNYIKDMTQGEMWQFILHMRELTQEEVLEVIPQLQSGTKYITAIRRAKAFLA